MPILESFLIDHTKIVSPSIRKAKVFKSIDYNKKNNVTIFDLRFCKPNIEIISSKGIHTLEHLFSNFMRLYLDKYSNIFRILDISPMGCRTGFYFIVIGDLSKINYYNIIIKFWKKSMEKILFLDENKKNIPGANIYQCGSYLLHSINEAKLTINSIVNKRIHILYNKNLFLNKNDFLKDRF